jgi:Novel STAND NTPase 1
MPMVRKQTALADRPTTIALRKAISDVKQLTALAIAVSSFFVAYWVLEKKLGIVPPWSHIISLIPFVLFGVLYLLPEWRTVAANRRLAELGIKGILKDPGYFRLIPYQAWESAKYTRPDNADVAISNWIERSSSTFLYIYGQSGVGKTSLLSAGVIPRLQMASPAWVAVEIRLRENPIESIRSALLKPDAVWRNPPNGAGLDDFALLLRAYRYSRDQGKRLLLIIDQFEETFIFSNDPQRRSLIELLRQVSQQLEDMRILFSLRVEYLSDLVSLELPIPSVGQNCYEVRAFTQSAAQQFLANSGLEFGTTLMQQTLAEAAEVEEIPDRIRPIVLNMMGLVLSAFKGILPKNIAPGRLLSGYVQRAIYSADIRAVAPLLLQHLITDVGTKRASSLNDLAARAKVSPAIAGGCLFRLAESGLVRRIETDRWEISHDFVSRLIQPIIQNWRKSVWSTTRHVIAGTSLVAWLGLLGLMFLVVPMLKDSIARQELALAGIVSIPQEPFTEPLTFPRGMDSRGSGGRIFAYIGTLSNDDLQNDVDRDVFKSKLHYFEWLNPPATILRIRSGRVVRDFDNWPDLPTIQHLKVSTDRLDSLKGLSSLPSLITIELAAERVDFSKLPPLGLLRGVAAKANVELVGMPNLNNLEILDIEGTVDSLAGLPKMPKLTTLNATVSNWGGMPSLPALRDFNLSCASNTDVFYLSGLNLPSLETFSAYCPLKSFAGMGDFPLLKTLHINSDYLSLKEMPMLPMLKKLAIGNVHDLSSMPSFPELSELKVPGTLLDLAELPEQPKLDHITFEGRGSEAPSIASIVFPNWMHPKSISGISIANQADVDKLANIATELESAELSVAKVDFSKLSKVKILDLSGNLTDLKSLSTLPHLKRLRLSAGGHETVDVDFASLRVLRKDIQIVLHAYWMVKIPDDVKDRIEFDRIEDKP